MRSQQLNLDQYDTDKIPNGLMSRYDVMFEPWVDEEMTLLELGIHRGGSQKLWRDYIRRGTIVGVDIKIPESHTPADRVLTFEGSQTDRAFLSQVANAGAPQGFDIIIDDASHIGEWTKTAFWHLFDNHLKPGGVYVIEDWPAGYWSDWPDGKELDLDKHLAQGPPVQLRSAGDGLWTRFMKRLRRKRPLACHSHGMVGFVKQLVDEQAAADVTRKSLRNEPGRSSKFESLLIGPSQVFVAKAKTAPGDSARATPDAPSTSETGPAGRSNTTS